MEHITPPAPYQSNWFALFCIIGYGVFSSVLLWIHGAGAPANHILAISLIIPALLVAIAASPALRLRASRKGLLISSGWVAASTAWAMCLWALQPRYRVTWIGEQTGAAISHTFFLAILAGVSYSIVVGANRLFIKRPLPSLAVWAALVFALITYEGLRWGHRLFAE